MVIVPQPQGHFQGVTSAIQLPEIRDCFGRPILKHPSRQSALGIGQRTIRIGTHGWAQQQLDRTPNMAGYATRIRKHDPHFTCLAVSEVEVEGLAAA